MNLPSSLSPPLSPSLSPQNLASAIGIFNSLPPSLSLSLSLSPSPSLSLSPPLSPSLSPQNLVSAIGIFNSLFIIVFTAHILGCAFTMLADAEPGDNWMIHYEPALLGATNDVRYIAAIYWAIVRCWLLRG